jgi:hypothetical protein
VYADPAEMLARIDELGVRTGPVLNGPVLNEPVLNEPG